MRNHLQDRYLSWKHKYYTQVRFLPKSTIYFLLNKYLINNKLYAGIKGSEWREILANELKFRKQRVDAEDIFFSLLFKQSDKRSKMNILYLINPDLSVKQRTELADKLLSEYKEAKVAETNEV